MLLLIITSFFAGVLTVLTPCALPLLPVVLGASVTQAKNRWKPLVITISLAISVIIFTLILKVSSSLFFIPQEAWSLFSGIVILLLGVFTFFPDLWSQITVKVGFEKSSKTFLNFSAKRNDLLGSILTGIALGPIFSSCSPTYGYVVFTVLPSDTVTGMSSLIAYAIGLALILALISIFGQALISKLKWATDPYGNFRRALGIIFIVLGIFIIFQIDKQIESYLLDSPLFSNFSAVQVDQKLVDKLNENKSQ